MIDIRKRLALVALVSCMVAFHGRWADAESSYPMLMSVNPLAVQAGQTTECEVSARYNLYGAWQVLVSGSLVTGEVVPHEQPPPEVKEGEQPKKPQMPKLKVRFTAAPDAIPGVRSFRVVTPSGASTVGNLVVVRDGITVEAAGNNTPETAQAVTLPAALCGVIEAAEDLDFYKFTVAEGSGWTFHVQSSRCENQIHDLQTHSDPIITLRSASGAVLATSDNYFYGDPLLFHRFTSAGEYWLEIRDVRNHGNSDWMYVIEVSDRPFVTNLLPSRLLPGVATQVQLIGFNLPADPTATITLPPDTPNGPHWINLPVSSVDSAPVIVSRLPDLLEIEPPAPATAVAADGAATPAASALAQAQPLTVPAGVSGRIASPGDVDRFAFDAKQGERFSFEVVARRHQSALDSQLRIMNEQGGVLAENDDLSTGRHTYADSQLENWSAPADGRYVIELGDLHHRGGDNYVYYLEATRSGPYFTLDLDTDKTLLAPGTGGAIFVRVYRKNGFAGEVQLGIEGLPPGVSATCGRILAEGKDGAIILQAASDAARGAANVRITGIAVIPSADGSQPPRTLTAAALPMQEIYMPGGGRNHYPVDMHTVSVGDLMDLSGLSMSTTTVRLKPGESQRIDITIARRPGFTGNVSLDCLFQHLGSIYGNTLPPGISIDEKNSQTVLTGEQAQGYITLTASADAKPVENQLVAVMANVSINFVMKYTYTGPPLVVSVAAP